MSRIGRPKGSKNHKVDQVDAGLEQTRCRRCGSTRRSQYYNKRTLKVGNQMKDGLPFNRTTWRRTKCLDCGQFRDDITRDLVPDKLANSSAE